MRWVRSSIYSLIPQRFWEHLLDVGQCVSRGEQQFLLSHKECGGQIMPLLRAVSASTGASWEYPKFLVVTSWEVASHMPQGKKQATHHHYSFGSCIVGELYLSRIYFKSA